MNEKNNQKGIAKSNNLMSLHDAMNQLFRDSFWDPFGSLTSDWQSSRVNSLPKIDVVENEKNVVIKADVPGLSENELGISVNDNNLTISGEYKSEKEEGEKNSQYYRLERNSGSFSRTVSLPSGVDTESVEATLKDGVLSISLAKIDTGKSKKIKINKK